jgi:hypothetical protein
MSLICHFLAATTLTVPQGKHWPSLAAAPSPEKFRPRDPGSMEVFAWLAL